MKTFAVYFEQVNQESIEVQAETKEQAKTKAKRVWKRRNGEPYVLDCKDASNKEHLREAAKTP